MSKPWWVKYFVKNLDVNRVDLVSEGCNTGANIKLYKNKPEGGEQGMKFSEILKKLTPEDQAAINAELEKAKQCATGAAGAGAEGEGEEGADPKPKEKEKEKAPKKEEPMNEEMFKGMPNEMTQLFKSMQAQLTASNQIIKSMQESALEGEAIAKAKSVVGCGADEATLVELYKSLKGLDVAICDQVFGILSTNAQVTKSATGLTRELGATGGVDVPAGSADEAWAKIEAAASEIAKSRNISMEAATSDVVMNQPELYQQYVDALQ